MPVTEAPAGDVADVDPAISAWIDRLLAKNPSDRPESAPAAWDDLEDILIAQLGPRWRGEARLHTSPPPRVPAPQHPHRPSHPAPSRGSTWTARASTPAATRPTTLTDVSLSAGWLLALGALISVTALGLLKFTIERLSRLSTLLAVIVLLGALAALAAGVDFLRVAPEPSPVTFNPGPLVLGIVGVVLAGAALFINDDGFSSLWLEF